MVAKKLERSVASFINPAKTAYNFSHFVYNLFWFEVGLNSLKWIFIRDSIRAKILTILFHTNVMIYELKSSTASSSSSSISILWPFSGVYRGGHCHSFSDMPQLRAAFGETILFANLVDLIKSWNIIRTTPIIFRRIRKNLLPSCKTDNKKFVYFTIHMLLDSCFSAWLYSPTTFERSIPLCLR